MSYNTIWYHMVWSYHVIYHSPIIHLIYYITYRILLYQIFYIRSNTRSNGHNVDKTKVMASDGIACRILIQNEQFEQVDTFPYLGSLATEDGKCTTEFCAKQRAGDRGISAENMEKSQHTDFNKDMTNDISLVWPVATYGCESSTRRTNEEASLRWKDWERFCGFLGQQRKQMSGFLTKLE